MFGSKDTTVVSGWLNKRKRKKLQGFAKRWVVLDENGILSYSLGPNHRPRETIRVSLATIARSKRHRDIHIDCGWTLWHFKALTDEDWEKWTVALRRFITVSETEAFSGSATNNRKSRRNKHGGGSRVVEVNSDQPQIDFDDLSDVVNQMASHLKDAQTATQAVAEPDHPGNREKVKAKLNIFGKKGGDDSPQAAGLKQLQSSLASLQREHDRLSNLVAGALGIETGRTGGYSAAAFASRSAMGLKSVGSTMSDETEDGYEDAREFDLDAVGGGGEQSGPESGNASSAPSESEAEEGGDDDDDDDSTDETSVSSGDTAKDEGKKGKGGGGGGWLGRKKGKKDEGKDDAADDGGDEGGDDDTPAKDPVKRRTELPHGVAGDETSMFSVLKKNMGKDLSKISMPITFNEPISALERLAEDFEYCDLLNRAAKTEDPIDRIALVTAWAVSGFSASKNRGARKPFNPMLGETYELQRQDLGLKFMSEKVSHHPPVMAAYVEGKGWTFTADSGGRQKFWGRSMEYMPEGSATLKFKEHDCEYTIDERPSVFVRNIMSGTKYIENQGEMKISASTGEKATIKFEQSGWGGGSKNKISGELKDSNGKSAAKLEGKWDEELSRKGDGDNYQRLWKVHDFPKDAEKYYGFSTFAMQLNEITDDIKDKLPPFDSRKRPDQSAFEQGDVDKAEELKKKLEENQRSRRAEWEKSNKGAQPPQFFKQNGKKWEYNVRPRFVSSSLTSKGEYWDKREQGEFSDIKIFDV